MENKINAPAFFDDIHIENIKNFETYDFTILATTPNAAHATRRNRVIIPDDDGHYREFIILDTIQLNKKRQVKTVASYIELKKSKRISPIVLEGQTVNMSMDWTLVGTGWQRGITEYAGIRKVTIEGYQDPYQTLKQLASLYDLEIRFRIEVDGSRIIGRYVDMLKKRGEDTKKETRIGKDLIGVERIENADIVTALRVLGPEQEDGQRLIVEVKNEDARKRWSRDGKHLWEDYEPSIAEENVTVARLTQLGEAQLAKRINSTVQYTAEAVAMEEVFGYTHEKVRLGDTNRIIDDSYVPSLYLEARVIEIRRSIAAGKVKRKYVLGDFIEYNEEDLMKTFLQLQILYGHKIVRNDIEPSNPRQGMVWVDTSGVLDVIYTWNHYAQKWDKATPTVAEEVGAYDKETVDNKDKSVLDDAAWYTDVVSEEKKQEAIQHTNTEVQKRELAILRQATEPIGPNFTVGQLWLRTTDDVYFRWTGVMWKQITPSLAEIAEKAGLDYVNDQLSGKASLEALADKADLTYVDGELISKANKAETYTKVEVDNAVDSRVSVISYNTDQNGVVQRFESAESRISQTESGLTSKVSQIDFNAVEGRVSTAETNISQHASLIESKVSQSVYDIDRNGIISRLDTAESTIIQQAGLIEQRVTTTTYNAGMAGKENTVFKQNTAPSHTSGRLWLDTSKTPNVLMRSTGSAWVKATPTTAGEVGAYSSSEGSALAGRVTTAESTISQHAGLIESKVNQSVYENDRNGIISRLNNAESSITQQANEITQRVRTEEYLIDQNALKSRVQTAESTITQHASAIALRVEKNGVLAAINLSTEGTRILSSLLHIDGNVTFANGYDPTTIEIGGTNILRGSRLQSTAIWGSGTTQVRTAIDGGHRVRVNYGQGTNFGFQITSYSKTSISANRTYTISFDVRGNVTNMSYIYLMRADGENAKFNNLTVSLSNSEYTRYKLSITAPWSSEQAYILMGSTDVGAGKWFEVKNIKLEDGLKDTSWSPCPYDEPINEWVFGNTTEIDGGKIRTNTVTANQISVTSLSALSANLGTVTAGNISGVNISTVGSQGSISLSADRVESTNANRIARLSNGEGLFSSSSLVTMVTDSGGIQLRSEENGLPWSSLQFSRINANTHDATLYASRDIVLSGGRDINLTPGVGRGINVQGNLNTNRLRGLIDPVKFFLGIGDAQIDMTGGDLRIMRDNNNYIRINNGSIQFYVDGVSVHTMRRTT